jgi:hypothetical protein
LRKNSFGEAAIATDAKQRPGFQTNTRAACAPKTLLLHVEDARLPGAHGARNITTQMLIHLLSHLGERLNIYATAAVDYSWFFTNCPFGSTSKSDSLPFALTNTS